MGIKDYTERVGNSKEENTVSNGKPNSLVTK